MSERKAFYVRCPRADGELGPSMCTGIQVIIPEDMSYWEAREYVIGRVVGEFTRYAVDECLTTLGFKK